MQIQFNVRGNGACPLCRRNKDCFIHDAYRKSAQTVNDSVGMGMELVIYTCPYFEETA